MKVLITGANGQLGNEMLRCLPSQESELGKLPPIWKNAELLATDWTELNIADQSQTQRYVQEVQPDVVFNCAAYTNVDACEAEPERAFLVNCLGARNIAMACERVGARLVHLSTDYVFNGRELREWSEWDQPDPQSVYGKSKLLGEQYVREFCSRYYVVRTSWLYGYQGANFVKTILRAARETGKVTVVDDQKGNPTNAADLAHHLLKLAATEEYGLYHCTGNGICSWYEFAMEFLQLAGISCDIIPCSTQQFPRPAKRPACSALDNQALRYTVGDEMRDWKDAVSEYMSHYDRESGDVVL